jgi:hypothetical protein
MKVWDKLSLVTEVLKQEEGVRANQLDAIAGLAQVLLNKGVKK